MKDPGKVITVNGPVEPDQLGVTLMHEHLLFTCLMWFLEGSHRGLGSDSYVPVTPHNAALLREFPYRSRDNLINTDWRLSAQEIRRFKMALGRSVVDSSNLGLGRDVWGLRKIADDVGINIISGTGYYVDHAHPWYVDSMTAEELAKGMIGDITTGADGTDIRCGLIGEIGTSDPVTRNEWKVLEASAITHHATGRGHPDPCPSRAAPDALHPRLLDQRARGPSQPGHSWPPGPVHRRPALPRRRSLPTTRSWNWTTGVTPARPTGSTCPMRTACRLWSGWWRTAWATSSFSPTTSASRPGCHTFGGPGWDHIMNVILPSLRERGMSVDNLYGAVIDNPSRALALAMKSE